MQKIYCSRCGELCHLLDKRITHWNPDTGNPHYAEYYVCPKIRWWHMPLWGGHSTYTVHIVGKRP